MSHSQLPTPKDAGAGDASRERRSRTALFLLLLLLFFAGGVTLASLGILLYGGCLEHGLWASCIGDILTVNMYGMFVITMPLALLLASPGAYWLVYRKNGLRWPSIGRSKVREKEKSFMELP